MKRKTVFAFLLCVLLLLSGCKIENKHKPDPEPVQPTEKTDPEERPFNDGTWSLVNSVFKTGEYTAVNYFTSLNGAVGDGVYDAGPSRNYNIFALDEHIDRFFGIGAYINDLEASFLQMFLHGFLQFVSAVITSDNYFVGFHSIYSFDI